MKNLQALYGRMEAEFMKPIMKFLELNKNWRDQAFH